MLTEENEIRKVLHGTVWDYKLDPYDLYLIAVGKKEPMGWFNKEWALARFCSTLSWYQMLDVFGPDYLRENLTFDVIKRLWPKDMRERYELIRAILHGETVPNSGWSTENQKRLKATALSYRRYNP